MPEWGQRGLCHCCHLQFVVVIMEVLIVLQFDVGVECFLEIIYISILVPVLRIIS